MDIKLSTKGNCRYWNLGRTQIGQRGHCDSDSEVKQEGDYFSATKDLTSPDHPWPGLPNGLPHNYVLGEHIVWRIL